MRLFGRDFEGRSLDSQHPSPAQKDENVFRISNFCCLRRRFFRANVVGEVGTVPCPGFGLTQSEKPMGQEIDADRTAEWENRPEILNSGSNLYGIAWG
jgi:hypothetical protein